jgi:catechol 2,3-dioxygenase-like lactoylglutathione lyase family enzyme
MDWKLELVSIPVTDVDRAKRFYTEKAGVHADHDHQVNDKLRFVQLTPPGSACSIVLGVGITDAPPGSAQVQLVVPDVQAARAELIRRGLDVGEVQSFPWGSFGWSATGWICRTRTGFGGASSDAVVQPNDRFRPWPSQTICQIGGSRRASTSSRKRA